MCILFILNLVPFRFHSSWLRFSCQCENCKQGHSGQRTFDIASLPDAIKILDISVFGKFIVVLIYLVR